ncbi:MAG: peptidylprolyl isomerase, partial [Ruminiclostridium sp.]|nr:peptidylprolyl isomerase [Ruminiclostridium sp.]
TRLGSLPDEVKERYSHVGGLYDLDGEDTVFGQVVDGFDVLEKLNEVETVNGNKNDDKQDIASKPIEEIVIEKIEILKIAVEEETTATEKTRPTKAPEPTEDSEQIVVDDDNAPDTDEENATDPEPAAPSEDDTNAEPDNPAEDETQGENADETKEETEAETADNSGDEQPEEETTE